MITEDSDPFLVSPSYTLVETSLNNYRLILGENVDETKFQIPEILPLETFDGKSLFIQNYRQAFPSNPFQMGWTLPFYHGYNSYGITYVLPILWFDGRPIGLFFREIFGSKKLNTYENISYWYGMETLFKGWTPSDPVILVEGPKDRISVSRFYPYVQSILSSGFSGSRLSVFASIVKKVIILFDEDDAGRKGAEDLERNLSSREVQFNRARLPQDQDPGAYLEKLYLQSPSLEKLILSSVESLRI